MTKEQPVKHDDGVNLVKERGITKLNKKSVIGERSAKQEVPDNKPKRQEYLEGSKNKAVEAPKKFWMA